MRFVLSLFAVGLAAVVLAGCANTLSPEATNQLRAGENAYQQGDNAAALKTLDSFLVEHARSDRADEAYYFRGLTKYRVKDLAGANADFDAALARTKSKTIRSAALTAIGDIAYDTDDMNRAQTSYQLALEDIERGKSPSDHVHYRLGCTLQRLGKWDEADVQFDRVVYLFPKSEVAARAALRVHSRAWTIQAGSYANKDSAGLTASDLTARGYLADVRPMPRDGKLTYLIHVSRYMTYEGALKVLPEVRKLLPDAFVTTTQ